MAIVGKASHEYVHGDVTRRALPAAVQEACAIDSVNTVQSRGVLLNGSRSSMATSTLLSANARILANGELAQPLIKSCPGISRKLILFEMYRVVSKSIGVPVPT